MVQLYEDERLDYLLGEELRIIQSPSVFSFSLDAVLLSHFAYVPINKGEILDLCTGNAVIPLFLSTRTKGNVTGVEIQERLYKMGLRSVEYNDLQDRIKLVHGDLKEMPQLLGYHQFDVVTCNPPYFEVNPNSEKNPNEHLAIARHEIMCTLDDVVQASSQLVKQGGKVAFVHRPERLLDILLLMREYKIEPKRLQFIYPKRHKEANTILIEGIKDGKKGLKTLAPLVVYEDNNEYTQEMNRIIHGK